MQTVLCMKWGARYPAGYVNWLWSMIARNTQRPTQLICFTDDASGLDDAIIVRPLPAINIPEDISYTPWRKLSVWQDGLVTGVGDLLFIDLDMVITGSVDVFFDYKPGEYCVIHNWTQPRLKVGNTSVFRFPAGRYRKIFDEFNADPEAVRREFRIEQQYISNRIPEQNFWPENYVVSFKHSLLPKWPMNFFLTPQLPTDVHCVAFTGKPDPEDAVCGHWPVEASWKRLYKHVRPAPWIAEHWC